MSILLLFPGICLNQGDRSDRLGSAQIRIVNASKGSFPVNFYLLEDMFQEGLRYREHSQYLTVRTGESVSAYFRYHGTDHDHAVTELSIEEEKLYTLYLTGSYQCLRIEQYEDQLCAPPSGKAKIKFVHLAEVFTRGICIKDIDGAVVIKSLKSKMQSHYENIDPGNFIFSIYEYDSDKLIRTFEIENIIEGSIYTIYFSGGSSDELEVCQIVFHDHVV